MEYLLTFFFLLAAHYVEFDHFLPWKMPSPQRIVLNYVIGTVGMLAPFAWKLWVLGEVDLLLRLGGFVMAAGLAPMLAYINDGWKKLKESAREQAELANLYKGQRHEPGEGM